MTLPDPNSPFVAVPTGGGRSAEEVMDDLIAGLDAYFDAHPDERPPNWDDDDDDDEG